MARRITTLGTPAAPSWSAEWLARVEFEETARGKRICGAVTMGAGPCLLGSEHPSGRCRYHGGVVSVGPPCENQNARVHGLYARRLQRCGDHCPLWKSCPFAGEDVMKLPEPQRPICAYERDEYAALMRFYFKAEDLTTEGTENTERGTAGKFKSQDLTTDRADRTDRDLTTEGTEKRSGVGNRVSSSFAEASEDKGFGNAGQGEGGSGGVVDDDDAFDDDGSNRGDVDPVLGLRFPGDGEECADPFLLHQLVLLTVMQTRAAAVLSAGTLTEAVEVESPGYRMKTAKPGAALEAFVRIAREWRALRGMIDTKKLVPKRRELGLASQMAPLLKEAKGCLEEALVDVPLQDISKYLPEWAKEEAVAGETSSELANGEVASGEIVISECVNGEIDGASRGAAESVGVSANGERGAASGEMAGPVAEPEPLSGEESARAAAVRPPPLLWRDVLERRTCSRRDGFLFGDRGGWG